jgi:hypothetical protein
MDIIIIIMEVTGVLMEADSMVREVFRDSIGDVEMVVVDALGSTEGGVNPIPIIIINNLLVIHLLQLDLRLQDRRLFKEQLRRRDRRGGGARRRQTSWSRPYTIWGKRT